MVIEFENAFAVKPLDNINIECNKYLPLSEDNNAEGLCSLNPYIKFYTLSINRLFWDHRKTLKCNNYLWLNSKKIANWNHMHLLQAAF